MAKDETDSLLDGRDIMDSRDVIARIKYLEEQREAAEDADAVALEEAQAAEEDADAVALEEAQAAEEDAGEATGEDAAHVAEEAEAAVTSELADWDASDDAAELAQLKAFAEELEQYAEDWHHGGAIIRESHFKDWARRYALDTGALDKEAQWPMNCIDWEQAAEELQVDFASAELDGVTYWTRGC